MEKLVPVTSDTITFFSPFIPELLKEEFLINKSLFFYGIVCKNTACGVIVLEKEAYNCQLRYIFVAESFRGLGIATRIFSKLLWKLYEEGYKTVKTRYCPKSSPELHHILRGRIVRKETLSTGAFSFTLKEIKNASLLNSKAPHVVSLNDVKVLDLKKFCQQIIDSGNDIIPMPIHKEDYQSECSAVYMENGIPTGILLLQETSNESVIIPFLYSASSKSTAVLEMICFLYQKGLTQFSENTKIEMYTIAGSLTALLEKLTGLKADYQIEVTLDFSSFRYYENQIKAFMTL